VSISNSIGSMRLLAVMDWREFVESLSHRRPDAAPATRTGILSHKWTLQAR
jgi:hypothetical protein